MRPYSAKGKRTVSRALKARLDRTILQRRRETIYRMLAKKHAGQVPCFCCGEHVAWADATVEHIVPRSKGGTDEMSNLSISHARCNLIRGDAMPKAQHQGGG